MKKAVGYLFWDNEKRNKDLKAFEKIARKKGIELITFNLMKELEEEEIEKKAKRCDIVYNNSGEEFAIELVKTLENLGKKVIDSSEIYYYTEDKWMFFLKCKENGIPTPMTILLSESVNLAKKELTKFGKWPVILKRIEGSNGNFVEKADNVQEAEEIIKKFWKKEGERLPIIAQEFIPSPSYRVMTIKDRVIQTAIKEGTRWKHTGNAKKRFRKIKIDSELKKLVKKIAEVMKINVCGIDLLEKDGKWVVLEVNSNPGLDFFNSKREKLAEEILDFLVTISNKKIKTENHL